MLSPHCLSCVCFHLTFDPLETPTSGKKKKRKSQGADTSAADVDIKPDVDGEYQHFARKHSVRKRYNVMVPLHFTFFCYT